MKTVNKLKKYVGDSWLLSVLLKFLQFHIWYFINYCFLYCLINLGTHRTWWIFLNIHPFSPFQHIKPWSLADLMLAMSQSYYFTDFLAIELSHKQWESTIIILLFFCRKGQIVLFPAFFPFFLMCGMLIWWSAPTFKHSKSTKWTYHSDLLFLLYSVRILVVFWQKSILLYSILFHSLPIYLPSLSLYIWLYI
jgi:hypothetical protein